MRAMSGVRLNLSPNSSNVLRRLLLFLVLALLCCKVESCITHYAEQKLVKESGIVSLSELSRKVENKIKNLWNANHHDLFNCFLTMSESDISDVESRVSVESKTSPHARLPLQLVSASPTANPSATPNPSGSPVVHSTPSPSPGMAYLFIKILLRSFVTEEISSEIRLDLADAANVPIHNITLVNLQAGPILTYVLETERQLAPSLVQSLTFYIKSGQLAASINRGPIILVDDPIEFSEAGQSVNESQVAPGLRSTPLPTAGFHRVLYEVSSGKFFGMSI